jgi:four helix bundle protein
MSQQAKGPWNQPRDLKERTKQFALRIIRLVSSLPQTQVAQVIGHQLLKAGTSVGAHYREGCRGRSSAEFVAKLNGGLIELEESSYWLELLEGAGIIAAKRLTSLEKEAGELTAIFVTCIINAKRRAQR